MTASPPPVPLIFGGKPMRLWHFAALAWTAGRLQNALATWAPVPSLGSSTEQTPKDTV